MMMIMLLPNSLKYCDECTHFLTKIRCSNLWANHVVILAYFMYTDITVHVLLALNLQIIPYNYVVTMLVLMIRGI